MTPLEFDLQESGDPLMPVQLIASLKGPRTTTRGVQEENRVEQHIFCRNTPFGTATEHGTVFIG
jgi:porphyrinogen peroxidase